MRTTHPKTPSSELIFTGDQPLFKVKDALRRVGDSAPDACLMRYILMISIKQTPQQTLTRK